MSYQNILVPLDGSEFARRAIEEAIKIGNCGSCRILLVGVVEIPIAYFEGYGEFVAGLDVHEKLREHIAAALDKEVAALRERGVRAEARVDEGIPPERILAICVEEKVDLIVMTTHGRRGFAHLLLGSVAEKLVRMAPCSVLVVRPRSNEL